MESDDADRPKGRGCSVNQSIEQTRAAVIAFRIEGDLDRFDYRSLSGLENIVYHALRRALAKQPQPVAPVTPEQVLGILRTVPANLTLRDFTEALPGLRLCGALREVDFGIPNLENGGYDFQAPVDFLGDPWPKATEASGQETEAVAEMSISAERAPRTNPLLPEPRPDPRHGRSFARIFSFLSHLLHHLPPGVSTPAVVKN